MEFKKFLFKLAIFIQCIGVTYWLGKFALGVFIAPLGQLSIFGLIGAILSLIVIVVDWIVTAFISLS